MNGIGNGNSDEFMALAFQTFDGKDSMGRALGKIVVSARGMAYFGGGPMERLPFRWYHICTSVNYVEGVGAER